MVARFVPNADSPVYLYVQLADYLADRIAAGDLRSGTRLPAEGDLADSYGVSLGTARRAVAELRRRNLVTTVAAKGTFVR
jgi:DNA-binding GntR family transcriptional regulator